MKPNFLECAEVLSQKEKNNMAEKKKVKNVAPFFDKLKRGKREVDEIDPEQWEREHKFWCDCVTAMITANIDNATFYQDIRMVTIVKTADEFLKLHRKRWGK